MRILILTVAVFGVSWLPLNLFHLISDFSATDSGSKPYSTTLFLVVHWFAMSSVCYNPIIFYSLNYQYRCAARKILRKLFCCNRSRFCYHRKRRNKSRITHANNNARYGDKLINNGPRGSIKLDVQSQEHPENERQQYQLAVRNTNHNNVTYTTNLPLLVLHGGKNLSPENGPHHENEIGSPV